MSGERTGGRLPPSPEVVDRERDGERMLAAVCAPWRERYPDVGVTYEAVPVAAARLLRDASGGAAAVVVGSRGRNAVAGMLLGSVSQSVLTHASCPVVVAR